MKFNKKTVSLICVIMTLILSFSVISSCGLQHKDATSVDIGKPEPHADLYTFGSKICNYQGEILDEYSKDDTGNIIDTSGSVVVAAPDVIEFSYITDMSVMDPSSLKQKIPAHKADKSSTKLVVDPCQFTIQLAGTAETINNLVQLESTDPSSIYFPFDKNKDNMSATAQPADNALPDITVQVGKTGMVDIAAVGLREGSHQIRVKDIFGQTIQTFDIQFTPYTVTADPVATDSPLPTAKPTSTAQPTATPSATAKPHEHSYKKTVTAATASAQGYTTYTCTVCGYSYRGDYTAKLNCTHKYSEKVVAPTYTTEGYTLHTCSLCGASYKDKATAKLTCNHAITEKNVVQPTCTAKGYTSAQCTVCRNHTAVENEVPALGHNWDNGTTVKAGNCEQQGEVVYKCLRCGITKSEKINSTGSHNYVVSKTVSATCSKEGYTEYVCSACGATKKDNVVPATGQHNIPYQNASVTVATCTEDAYAVGTCIDCGTTITKTQEGSALGHTAELTWVQNADGTYSGSCQRCGKLISTQAAPEAAPVCQHDYYEVVSEPGCLMSGFTSRVCSKCGDSSVISSTPALGHNWVETEYQACVGSYEYWVCNHCGFSGDYETVGDHIYTSPECFSYQNALGGIYETKICYICSNCNDIVDHIPS